MNNEHESDAASQTTAPEPEGQSRRNRTFEIIATVLLSIAITASAYCAYEATRWSGVQAIALAQASALRIESSKAQGLANAQIAYDATLFTQLGVLYSQENTAGFTLLRDRMTRKEFRPYLDEWIALKPLENADVPRTPFDLPSFSNAQQAESDALIAQAEMRFKEAEDANQTGDDYVLATVFLAGVLFFAGISSKFDGVGVRVALLSLACVWLVIGATRMLSLPFH